MGSVALLRAAGLDISATPRGYLLRQEERGLLRTVACRHAAKEMEAELIAIVDNGCTVMDVIVEHPVYGQLTGPLDLSSRYDVSEFIRKVEEHAARPLSLLTDGIHTIQPTDGMPYMPDGVAAFKGAANVDGAKEFIEWLFSSDENLKELAAIDKKNTIKLCIPSLEGVELDFDEKALMKEDISQFGEIRDAVLEKWDQMTSGKEVQEGSK